MPKRMIGSQVSDALLVRIDAKAKEYGMTRSSCVALILGAALGDMTVPEYRDFDLLSEVWYDDTEHMFDLAPNLSSRGSLKGAVNTADFITRSEVEGMLAALEKRVKERWRCTPEQAVTATLPRPKATNDPEEIVCSFLREISPSRDWYYLGEHEHALIADLVDAIAAMLSQTEWSACSECGRVVPMNVRFCNKCGKAVSDD